MTEIAKYFTLQDMAEQLGATTVEGVPGLWSLEGHPELTEGQIIAIWLASQQ